jgi:hypothetical protein
MRHDMTRKPHDGEIEYCRCGTQIELSRVVVSEAGEFECPWCGHTQYCTDKEEEGEVRPELLANLMARCGCPVCMRMSYLGDADDYATK